MAMGGPSFRIMTRWKRHPMWVPSRLPSTGRGSTGFLSLPSSRLVTAHGSWRAWKRSCDLPIIAPPRRGLPRLARDSAVYSYRLEGLEPDNLLAFLALLGLLRALEVDDRGRANDAKLRPRAAWDVDFPPLRPTLALSRHISLEEVTERAARGLDALAMANDFGGRKGLDHSLEECRALLKQVVISARLDARERADLLAALMSDGAIKDNKEQSVDPTPLCLLFGQGTSSFF